MQQFKPQTDPRTFNAVNKKPRLAKTAKFAAPKARVPQTVKPTVPLISVGKGY